PHDLRARHQLVPVTAGLVARPEVHILHPIDGVRPEQDHRMAALEFADFIVPPDLHEITRARLGPIGKIAPKLQFREEPRRAGTIGIPAAPEALAIALAMNGKGGARFLVETEPAFLHQVAQDSDENEVGRPRAITRAGLERVEIKTRGIGGYSSGESAV